jgi:ABC-2 type transport system permease protein
MNAIGNYFNLVGTYIRFNLRAQMEYRGAFISQIIAMFLNDGFWLIFWVLFFSKFPVLRGWQLNDVVTMWAVAASSMGLAHSFCWNTVYLPSMIAKGQLDVWMLYPRRLLPHLILGKMNASSFGDFLFGLSIYAVIVRPDMAHCLLFLILTMSAALLILGFDIAIGSLGFFVGNSETLSEQWRFAFITLATYPDVLFEGKSRFLLFTLIPAGFINCVSVRALHNFSWLYALYAFLGALTFLAIGIAIFYLGLRRYESGNLMEMRG